MPRSDALRARLTALSAAADVLNNRYIEGSPLRGERFDAAIVGLANANAQAMATLRIAIPPDPAPAVADCDVGDPALRRAFDDGYAMGKQSRRHTPTDRIVVDQATMDMFNEVADNDTKRYGRKDSILAAHIARCVVGEVDRG